MNNRYSLRARVITLTLAPTLIIGLLLSTFFTFNRYHDLENQLIRSGTDIIEPLAIASEYGMTDQSREAVRRLISYTHRKHSDIVRSIAVFDANHQLFVTSNFHPNFESLKFDTSKPIPLLSSQDSKNDILILRAPILAEGQFSDSQGKPTQTDQALGYIAIELDRSSLKLQQYQEIFSAMIVLFLGIGLSGIFAYRLMQDVTRPITHMVSVVDKIRRGYLDVRIETKLHGELDMLKSGINAMAMSLSEYHVEMQHSIDQATSDLRETLEQLEIQNIELDIAKKRAQEAARVKSEFLANMSHELRTPLNGVLGFTRQLLKTQLNSNQVDYLQTIESSAQNLLSIINDILDFSKLEAGKLSLEQIPFDFQETLDEVVSLQAPSAHEKGLEITLQVDPNIPNGVVGDPLRITQVLTNLVGNAIKFTEQGNIDIFAKLAKDEDQSLAIEFVVRDTGIGISERQQTQLFQAFSQADASISRRYGGTGLGLVITQKLVSQMGGEIKLTSRLHQGSTFYFTLKLDKTDLPMSQGLMLDQLADQRILIIEPNLQTANIIEQFLAPLGMQINHQTSYDANFNQHDYCLINLSPAQEVDLKGLTPMLERATHVCSKVIVALPSTQLALAEVLSFNFDLVCIAKPIAKRKLLEHMLHSQAKTAIEPPKVECIKLPMHVLAVDDNPANLKLIDALLSDQVTQVTLAQSGLEAVEKAQEHAFDVVLMDIQMPHMDGVSASEKIHQTQLNQNTPCIAVTAHAIEGEKERLMSLGMHDYISKPLDEKRLYQALIYWYNGTNSAQQDVKREVSDASWHQAISGENNPSTVAEIQPEKQSQAQNMPVIDWPSALVQAANKPELAKEMLAMLVEFIPEVNQCIDNALANPDASLDAITAIIHKLHGSCAYSGVPKIKALCATIESGLRAGSPLYELEPELFELQDEMEKVTQASSQYLS
ncbi:MAG: two-component sensor histidine kinase BarA [Vibrio sp.]